MNDSTYYPTRDAEAAALRAKLAEVEAERDWLRDACHGFYTAGTKTHNSVFGTEAKIHAQTYWRTWDHYHARRSDERKAPHA